MKEHSGASLREVPWRISYRTSAVGPEGRPVDILHDFYIPALRRSVRYERVAGYFRSTSLAAASQGFSAFVGREGKMRLIVGADLDAEDVGAILSGMEERFADRLNAELEQAPEWPEAVTRGVELLAWMVAHGYLEVRVAFRVHGETGEPLALDSRVDGYVHEKWAIFADGGGNRLYVSGSLNESRTALSLNAENLDVHCEWWGERERMRVDEAERDFQAMWENQHPCLRVLTLPEAVKGRLVRISERVRRPLEIDGTSAAPAEVAPPSVPERLRFALLRDGPRLPGGRFVGMETAPVEPWPHQAVVARRLVETWPYSYLLCDEVGLGKTIEAGLAIRSLYLSGLARRVLIAPPANLTPQWHREMETKFLLPFGRAVRGVSTRHAFLLPFEEERPSASLYEPDLTIVSTGLLARRERQRELEAARPFDIVLIDEAHYARRQNPGQDRRADPRYGNLFMAIQNHLQPKARSLWLATATPMQINPVEVTDLLRLTNRVGAFQFDESLTLAYYEILGRLVDQAMPGRYAEGQPDAVREEEWAFLRRAVASVSKQDPLLWAFIEQTVIDAPVRLAAQQWLNRGHIPHRVDLRGLLRVLFSASPLSRVMLRHTRPLLEIYRDRGQLNDNLAERKILPLLKITFNALEQAAYGRLEVYCRGLASQIAEHGRRHQRSAVGFLLSFLRLRFASSLYAIRETLRRRLERVEATLAHLKREGGEEAEEIDIEAIYGEGEDDREAVESILKDRTPRDLEWERAQIGPMLKELGDLTGLPSKMATLLDVLEKRRIAGTGRIRQTVVFTRFYDTLTDIVGRLRTVDRGMRIGTYSGQGGQVVDAETGRLVSAPRERVKQRFLRGEIDVLACTDAAAEGLNLQTADLLVNFDLPWNPMKVEQRIGRIDRIGQKHERVFVLNLCYVDSVEEKVYGRLLRRLEQAGAIVGTQQMSLLPVMPDEFRELAEGELDEPELEKRALERAALARRRTASMEIPPEDLYEIYQRLSEQPVETPVPVDLDRIWEVLSTSRYLSDVGCRVLAEAEAPVLALSNIAALPEGTALTTSRAAYEAGVPDLEGRLHFASYGDPAFQMVLEEVASYDLPPCIRRVTAQVSDVAEVVGYAVACLENGVSTVRLVTSFKQLEGLQIDEGAVLTDEAVEPLKEALTETASREFRVVRAAERIEAENVKAGHSQLILDYLVMRSYLQMRARLGHTQAPFWQEVSEVEQIFEDRAPVLVHNLPVNHLKKLSGLLFDPVLPAFGDGRLGVPFPLRQAALDAICRLADGMRVKRSELLVESVIERAGREIENLTARLG